MIVAAPLSHFGDTNSSSPIKSTEAAPRAIIAITDFKDSDWKDLIDVDEIHLHTSSSCKSLAKGRSIASKYIG